MEGGGCNSGSLAVVMGCSRSTKISSSGCSSISISGNGGTHFSSNSSGSK